MEIKNTNTELIPKSIFKGTNADGSKFTVNEWSPNSIGNTPDMIGCSGVIAACFLTAIIAPLTFIFSIFSNAHRSLNIIGAILGTYFLIDCYNNWVIFMGIQIFVSNETILMLLQLTVVGVIGNIVVILSDFVFHKIITIILSLVIAGFALVYYNNNIEDSRKLFDYQKQRDVNLYQQEVDRAEELLK